MRDSDRDGVQRARSGSQIQGAQSLPFQQHARLCKRQRKVSVTADCTLLSDQYLLLPAILLIATQ